MRRDSFRSAQERLPAQLAAMLEPEFHDALDHPIRREVLRALNRSAHPRGVAELKAELRVFRSDELSYHLQVLRSSGTVASRTASGSRDRGRVQFVSEVDDDGRVRAVLRATEQWDAERREAAVAAGSSPLLTMFRVPRPVRTIRLRRRNEAGAGRDR